jgi:hypothetical protein
MSDPVMVVVFAGFALVPAVFAWIVFDLRR